VVVVLEKPKMRTRKTEIRNRTLAAKEVFVPLKLAL